MKITKIPVPMFEKGRKNLILGICIHISDGTASQVLATFKTEEKSSHYLILKSGQIWQFVEDQNTAWAQGRVINPNAQLILERLNENPNSYLLSIEHEGYGWEDITEEQYQSSGELIYELSKLWKTPLDRIHIIGHNEINKGKICPGKIKIDKLIEIAKGFKPKPPEPSRLRDFIEALIQFLKSWKLRLGFSK